MSKPIAMIAASAQSATGMPNALGGAHPRAEQHATTQIRTTATHRCHAARRRGRCRRWRRQSCEDLRQQLQQRECADATCPTHYDVQQGGVRAACRARRPPSLPVGPNRGQTNGRCARGVPSAQRQQPKARRDRTVCVPRLSCGSALVCRLSQHVRNPRISLRTKAHSVSTHACVGYARAFSRRRGV